MKEREKEYNREKKIDSVQPHTSDKSTRIEISVGIASPVERVCAKKKKKKWQSRMEAVPPFMVTGGKKRAITQPQRGKEGADHR